MNKLHPKSWDETSSFWGVFYLNEPVRRQFCFLIWTMKNRIEKVMEIILIGLFSIETKKRI